MLTSSEQETDTAHRYDIGTYKTFERADNALENMFANGEICEGEHPEIIRKDCRTRQSGPAKYRFVITAMDWSY